MNNNIHRDIRRLFRVVVRGDFSPIGVQCGDRGTLVELWKRQRYKVGVEIGVHRAGYSLCILNGVPDVYLHAVDPWGVYPTSHLTKDSQANNYQMALNRLKPVSDRVTIHKDYSENVYSKFKDGSLDFLFIDGDHTFDGCALDLIHWCPKVRDGGIVAVHDYNAMRRGGVIESVNAYTRCHLIAPWYVTREEFPTAFWVTGGSY